MLQSVTDEHVQIVRQALAAYTVREEPLGKGRYGIVFPAEHKETKKQVVVKITTDLASHRNERKYAQLMSHPHSVPLEAAGSKMKPKVGWLVFARIETSLYDWCQKFKTDPHLAPPNKRQYLAATLLAQLLPLLQALEEKNISHRDLHTGNILVDTKEPWFYLHDYGISAAFESKDKRNYRLDTVGLIRSARYVIMLDKWRGGIELPEEYTPEKLPQWLNEIIEIMQGLPKDARVPYARLQAIAHRFLRPASLTSVVEKDNEVVRKGMQLLDSNRRKFEAMLNRVIREPVKLKSRAKLLTETDIQVLEPHPTTRIFVYPDEGSPWMQIVVNNDRVVGHISQSLRNLSVFEENLELYLL